VRPEPTRAELLSGAPLKSRLERLARDKHSSLLRKSGNYGCKKFYSTGPFKIFSNVKLIFFSSSCSKQTGGEFSEKTLDILKHFLAKKEGNPLDKLKYMRHPLT
jgi:hypothetical protein